MSSYEYNQLLKFLYFEGYVDSYAEAEELLESMSYGDFEQILEKKDIPQEVALKIADTLKGAPKFSRRGRIAAQLRQYAVERNAKRIAKLQQNNEEVVEYLFVEGFADTIEGAEVMAENISEQWVNEILEGYQELNRKRMNRMTDQAMKHMDKGSDADWEKAYKIEDQRDTQTPEVSKAKAESNRRRGEEKRRQQK
jgi:hypothetical protein